MGPNDALIVRVFSREPDGTVADVTLHPQKDGEIVPEAEAGRTLHGLEGAYQVTLGVRDITLHSASSAPAHRWSGGVPYPTTSASCGSTVASGCR